MYTGELVPCLFDEGLIDCNTRGRHTAINCAQALQSTLEARTQTVLFGNVRAEVKGLGIELFAEAVELIDRLFLYVQDCHIAAHFTDCTSASKSDALCAPGHDVIASSELEHGSDILEWFCHFV